MNRYNNRKNHEVKPGNKFFAELIVQKDNSLKIKKAQKYTKLNQYRNYWKSLDTREFSRFLNRSSLVIN